MKDLMERASAGSRQAVMELYEKHWKGAAAICIGSLGDTDMAKGTVVDAFQNTWPYLLNNCIKTEEEFKTTLYRQAAILCRRGFMKKGMKGLPAPQNQNFLITKLKESYAPEASPLDNLLEMLPGLNRYLFVLHRIAGFDEKIIASITGYKKDVVAAALAAEEQNTERALELLNKNMGIDVDLEKEILRYQETAYLPEKFQQQIAANIEVLVKPYEKKRMIRKGLYAVCAAALVVVLCIVGISSSKKKTDPSFTETTEDTDSENHTENTAADTKNGEETGTGTEEMDETQAEEGSEGETEEAFEFVEGQQYYADIVIEGHGTVTVELDHETAPVTVENFVTLAEAGFYDGLTFHRIMDGFMMQGGDPNGDGTGGSEETIVGEFSENGYENNLSHTRGVISMARSSEYDSASSQFFIVHEDSTFLDGQYAAFGWVTEGMDIVDTICTEAEPTDSNGTIPAEQQPVITSIEIRTGSEEAVEE